MIQVQRMGHATVSTTDLAKSLAYYRDVNGLVEAGRDGDTVYLASKIGQLTVTLTVGDVSDCIKLSFEVAPGSDFVQMQKALADEGIASEIRSDPFPGTRRALAFKDIKGTTIELFEEWSFLADNRKVAGIGPLKLGHVAFYVADVKRVAAFYERVLGFRVSDWIGDFFVFMRCNSDHHSVNFFKGDATFVHHMAFELKDSAHLQEGCESLAMARIPLTWGPLRHGPGHNMAIYHRNPDDHVIEHYCELDQMKSEALGYFEPRPWHTDRPQRPKVWEPGKWLSGWGLRPTPEHTRGPGQSATISTLHQRAGARG
jgi:catechol 2,3-dioxygenase-like lactoylglutathione lyase family enzyme